MRDKITNIKTFLTKAHTQKDANYAWYNTYRKLNSDEIEKLRDYLKSKDFIKKIIVVNNIESTRPQRTWGDMPEWFRPDSMLNSFSRENFNNTFIFAIFNDLEVTNDEISEAVKSFPNTAEVILLEKEGYAIII